MAEQLIKSENLLPAGGLALPAALTGGGNWSFQSILRQPAVQKALPLIVLFAGLALAGLAWIGFQSPAQTPLFQGLAEADKASVADALKSAGISYSLDPGTGTITVADQDVHNARMLLAGQGLPKAAPNGDAIVASLPMGSSRAIEGETLRSAREAELSRTIEAIEAVKIARVHLALSEPSVFVRDEAKTSASVMLTLHQGRSLSAEQVRSIQFLVASSVPGLTPEQVSVVSQDGDLLSQFGSAADNSNFKHQVMVEDRFRLALAALLTPIVGANNFTTEVHAELDFSESQSTRETYPKDEAVLRREEGNKTASSAVPSPAAIGIPGATSNQPPPSGQLATQPAASGRPAATAGTAPISESYQRTFDVGREISVTHKPEGQVKRLTVAVALKNGKKPLSAAEITKLEALVKGAVGFNAERGDVVAISSHAFIEEADVQPEWWTNPWIMPLARQIAGLLAAIGVFFLVVRPILKSLKNRSAAAPGQEDTSDIERKLLQATDISAARRNLDFQKRTEMVRDLVKQDPHRAALVVKKLMLKEGANG